MRLNVGWFWSSYLDCTRTSVFTACLFLRPTNRGRAPHSRCFLNYLLNTFLGSCYLLYICECVVAHFYISRSNYQVYGLIRGLICGLICGLIRGLICGIFFGYTPLSTATIIGGLYALPQVHLSSFICYKRGQLIMIIQYL